MAEVFLPAQEKPVVAFHTLGCRLNFFETDGLATQVKKLGFDLSGDKNPDYFIINSCTVTNKADSKNRSIIRQTIKKYPRTKVVVTGCYAETDREALENIPGVYKVIGNSQKSQLSEFLALDWKGENHPFQQEYDRFAYVDVLPEGHTRSYLKIQDGCNRKCAYCKIPQARGVGVSRNPIEVLDQIKFLQDQGIGEIQLTGVNLGWYRDTEGNKGFISLLESILRVLDYSRIRLSSIEPPDVGTDLADLMQSDRFCKFLHVPLQSGSRKILRLMQRTYHPEAFRMRIAQVQSKVPGIFLGTDAIVGFPGEGEEEFQETIDILRDLAFAKIHAFPYSVRRKTKAEDWGDPIKGDTKKERILRLNQLSRDLHSRYVQSQMGKIEEGILESDGTLVTGNYIKGRLEEDSIQILSQLKAGQFLEVVITGYKVSEAKEGQASFRIKEKNSYLEGPFLKK